MRTSGFPISTAIMAVLASVLPAYLFLIRPPRHAGIAQWAIAEHGKLTIFGTCTGAIITIGFAIYGAAVAQVCRWAFIRFVIGDRPEGAFDSHT